METIVKIIPDKSKNESLLYGYVIKIASFISPVVQDVKDEFRENFGDSGVSI
jgi:hypothetical protein